MNIRSPRPKRASWVERNATGGLCPVTQDGLVLSFFLSEKLPISTRFRECAMNDEPMASGPDASALAASDTVIIVAYHLPIIIT